MFRKCALVVIVLASTGAMSCAWFGSKKEQPSYDAQPRDVQMCLDKVVQDQEGSRVACYDCCSATQNDCNRRCSSGTTTPAIVCVHQCVKRMNACRDACE